MDNTSTSLLIKSIDEIIFSEGINYLFDNRTIVKNKLLSLDNIDPSLVKMFIYSLDFDIEKEIKGHLDDKECVISRISELTFLDRNKCIELSKIYLHLYSKDEINKRKHSFGCGLDEFIRTKHKCSWKGNANWVYTNGFTRSYTGTMECECEVSDAEIIKYDLDDRLNKNPYPSNKSIEKIYNDIINKITDEEFEDYVTAEKYYEPCIEDLEGDFVDRLNFYLNEYGIDIVDDETTMEEVSEMSIDFHKF